MEKSLRFALCCALVACVDCRKPIVFDRRDATIDVELFKRIGFIEKMWFEEYASGEVYDGRELGGTISPDGTFVAWRFCGTSEETDLFGARTSATHLRVTYNPKGAALLFHFHPRALRGSAGLVFLDAAPSDEDVALSKKLAKWWPVNHYVFHRSGVWRIEPDGKATKIMGDEWWK